MSQKTAIDLLVKEMVTLKSEKEKLATNVTEVLVENIRMKTYVAFLNEKIYNLQTELTRADEEKDKAERERWQIQNKEKLDDINEKDQLIKELRMRISQLDKENKEAAIESEKMLHAAEEENRMLRKELQDVLHEQQEQQRRANQTALTSGYEGTIFSGEDDR